MSVVRRVVMSRIKKVAIIGNAGSGKSLLAQKLGQLLKLPVFHLDQYFWQPNWVYPDEHEYKKVHDALCLQDAWIMDGMQLRLLETRIKSADMVIFLDMPLSLCLWRIFKRTWKYHGKETPSSAPGCTEGFFRWEFLKFIKWVCGFKAKYPPRVMKMLNGYSDKKQIHILRTPQEVDEFLKIMGDGVG